jgi:hypothetical protein
MSEEDLKLFKEWLKSHLNMGPVTVTFTKKDGSERIMKCTTDATYILFKDPTVLESKNERTVSEEVMPVYDLESNGWRSFRWDSIKRIELSIGESFEYSNKTQ